MRLYIVRHGEAVDSHVDPGRPLSAAGRDEAQRIGGFLLRNAVKVESVWHSSKARARETAGILHSSGVLGGEVIEQRGLLPEDHPEECLAAIDACAGDLCIVGHLPHVAYLASALLTGQPSAPFIAFETCSALCLERNGPGRWHLRWMISPSQLRG